MRPLFSVYFQLVNGGEGGIRTLGTLRFNGFRDRPIQPLSHLSMYLFLLCFYLISGIPDLSFLLIFLLLLDR